MEFVTAALVIIAVMIGLIGLRQERISMRIMKIEIFCDWFFQNVKFNEEEDEEDDES